MLNIFNIKYFNGGVAGEGISLQSVKGNLGTEKKYISSTFAYVCLPTTAIKDNFA